MSAKIDKVEKDIQKTKERIGIAQETLKALEKQRDELEKVELVHTMRTLKLTPADLKVFLNSVKNQMNVPVPPDNTVDQPVAGQNPEIIYREVEDEG